MYDPIYRGKKKKKKSCYTIPKTFRFKVFFPSLNNQKPSLCLKKKQEKPLCSYTP